jgi:hypothetical protein
MPMPQLLSDRSRPTLSLDHHPCHGHAGAATRIAGHAIRFTAVMMFGGCWSAPTLDLYRAILIYLGIGTHPMQRSRTSPTRKTVRAAGRSSSESAPIELAMAGLRSPNVAS